MNSIQDPQVIHQFKNWFTERTEFNLSAWVFTQELYEDYFKFTVEHKHQLPLKRKTFVTILKQHLRDDIKGARVSTSYKSKSAFQGLCLISDKRKKELQLVSR